MATTLTKAPKDQISFKVKASELSNKLLSRYNISNFDTVKVTVSKRIDPVDSLFMNDEDIRA